MKKTLIAVAALAATGAFAQNVTISGVLDAGFRQISVGTGVTGADSTTFAQNGTATSAIVLAGSEDLGGGMRASFRYEINPDFASGTGLTGGNSVGLLASSTATATSTAANSAANGYNMIGLSGAFGGVEFGRINTLTLAANGVANPFATVIGSGYGSYGGTNSVLHGFTPSNTSAGVSTIPTRVNQAFKYNTPTMSGFSAQVIYSPKVDETQSTTGNRQGVTELGASYVNGPLAVHAANLVIQAGAQTTGAGSPLSLGANVKATMNTVVAAYTVMPGLRIAGGYHTSKTDAASGVDTQTLRASATYTMGKTVLMGHYATRDDKATTNVDRKVLGLGVDYNLSARTALTARYESYDANSVSAADDKTTTLYAGLRVRF